MQFIPKNVRILCAIYLFIYRGYMIMPLIFSGTSLHFLMSYISWWLVGLYGLVFTLFSCLIFFLFCFFKYLRSFSLRGAYCLVSFFFQLYCEVEEREDRRETFRVHLPHTPKARYLRKQIVVCGRRSTPTGISCAPGGCQLATT